MNGLGEKIKKYRISLHLTQADFANKLGVTGAAVSTYENGSRLPSYDVLIKIANILNVTTDELLGRTRSMRLLLDVTGLTQEQCSDLQRIVHTYQHYNQLCGALREQKSAGAPPLAGEETGR